VFRHAASFTGGSSFKTWLYAIAANVCRSHAKATQKQKQLLLTQEPDRPDGLPGPNGVAESREIGRRIALALSGLPPEQREGFVLRAYDELSYREIADALSRPLGTVKSQMRLALRKLRTELRQLAEAYGIV